jgi:hypothetical protein
LLVVAVNSYEAGDTAHKGEEGTMVNGLGTLAIE